MINKELFKIIGGYIGGYIIALGLAYFANLWHVKFLT